MQDGLGPHNDGLLMFYCKTYGAAVHVHTKIMKGRYGRQILCFVIEIEQLMFISLHTYSRN